jgi:hypothetical protein
VSALSILCKEGVRISKGKDNAGKSRKTVGISVVIIENRSPRYSLKTTTWLVYLIPPRAPVFPFKNNNL